MNFFSKKEFDSLNFIPVSAKAKKDLRNKTMMINTHVG